MQWKRSKTRGNDAMAFVMQQMRRVIERFPDAGQALRLQVDALESNIESNPHVCLALSRTLIETCFKTIALQRGVEGKRNFKDQAETALGCIDHGLDGHVEEPRIRAAFETLKDGLSRLAMAMAELSNGGLDDQPTLDATRAHFFASFADAACAFAYECHRAEPRPKTPALEEAPEFNAYLDEAYPVQVAGIDLDASAALFHCDYEAYRAELEVWRSSFEDQAA